MFYVKPPADDAPAAEQEAWAREECRVVATILADLEVGQKVRRAGLIWNVPLCHDERDY